MTTYNKFHFAAAVKEHIFSDKELYSVWHNKFKKLQKSGETKEKTFNTFLINYFMENYETEWNNFRNLFE